jgi:hypothetical protein
MLRDRVVQSARSAEGSFVGNGLQFLLKLPAPPAHYQQLLVLNSMAMTKRTQHYILILRMTHDEASTHELSAYLNSSAARRAAQ